MIRFRLKELMERPGAPSQAELGRRIGVPRQQVNRLVNGDIERIDLKTLDKLFVALGCHSVDDLLHYTPERRDLKGFRERFIGELVGLTLSPVQQDREGIYNDPAVREAAEAFFDEHIARDLASGSLLASLHARLMQEMRDFVQRHGAADTTQAGPGQQESLEKLV
ncbi:MAG: helix-turn-helix transcriptional regulator, partial [Gemmatimonadetes bacterium]|nr:helix-turn-helix transcriptional regulator [Gemmatimonadota bacterium]